MRWRQKKRDRGQRLASVVFGCSQFVCRCAKGDVSLHPKAEGGRVGIIYCDPQAVPSSGAVCKISIAYVYALKEMPLALLWTPREGVAGMTGCRLRRAEASKAHIFAPRQRTIQISGGLLRDLPLPSSHLHLYCLHVAVRQPRATKVYKRPVCCVEAVTVC